MKKEIQSVKNYFNETMGSLRKTFSSFLSWVRSKKLTVQTEVQGVEKVEQAKQKIESLPKTRTVEMKIEQSGNFSALEMTGKNLEKNISVRSEVSGLDQVQQLGTAVNQLPKTMTIAPPQLWRRCVRLVRPVRQPAGTLHCAALL